MKNQLIKKLPKSLEIQYEKIKYKILIKYQWLTHTHFNKFKDIRILIVQHSKVKMF